METEIEAIKEAYAALNRNDIDGFVRDFDPQIVRVEFEGFPSAGTYHGIEAVKTHVTAGRSTWAEGTCEPEQFTVVGNKIVIPVHVHVRVDGHTEWIDAHTADAFAFRDGKVIEFRSFFDEQQALEWAGIED